MIFSIFFKGKRPKWKNSKQFLKSTTDLRLLPEQVIYVEGSYNVPINKIISKKHNEIYSKLKSGRLSTEFVYLPFVAKQLQNPTSFSFLLKYYFPNMEGTIHFQNNIHSVFQTDIVSHSFFSSLGYNDQIISGFFRYIGKNKENLFVYEYFPFVGSSKSSILKQIDYYISSVSENQDIEAPSLSNEEEDIFFDDVFRENEIPNIEEQQETPFPKGFFEKEIASDPEEKKNTDDLLSSYYHKKKESGPLPRKIKSGSLPRKLESFSHSLFNDDEYYEKEHYGKELDLIFQIKSDIQNLKELGFYELLIKELGNILFEQDANRIFQPSRLLIDEEFKIYLPDFNNIEIIMTPLPKTLFILFLRHPEGINLKSLIEYKKELLEIYKLLSYRETYFNMVESVNRICNPFEGSINEKLSRIKEAFLKKISMDTAKYYIVVGERGMNKKIKIDRSLIELPNAFNEIGLTKFLE